MVLSLAVVVAANCDCPSHGIATRRSHDPPFSDGTLGPEASPKVSGTLERRQLAAIYWPTGMKAHRPHLSFKRLHGGECVDRRRAAPINAGTQ